MLKKVLEKVDLVGLFQEEDHVHLELELFHGNVRLVRVVEELGLGLKWVVLNLTWMKVYWLGLELELRLRVVKLLNLIGRGVKKHLLPSQFLMDSTP
jgi:hypothetical protein